jgi:glycopeptide antibiotics resistance protein
MAVLILVIFKLWESPLERIARISALKCQGVDNANTIPFRTLRMCFDNINGGWARINLVGNTFPFFILGISGKYAWRESNHVMFFAISVGIVLCEIIQYVFLLGVCDIDDVILDLLFLKLGFYLLK